MTNAIKNLDDSSKKIHKTSLQALVIDVQGNPGGPLQSGLELASMFLPKHSPLLKMTTHNKTETYKSLNNRYISERKMCLLVLTDQGTASASEVFATAVMDNQRAVVAGAKTLGKNLAQALVRLSDHSAISLTVALFKGPYGKDLECGIQPHLTLKSSVFMSAKPSSRQKKLLFHQNLNTSTSSLSRNDYQTHHQDMNPPRITIENIRFDGKNRSWAVEASSSSATDTLSGDGDAKFI